MADCDPFGIYIASYHRAKTATTHKFLEYYQYVVRKSEETDYREAGIEHVLAVEDELICGLTEVNQWLIDNAPEPVICILDDDIHHFYYRLDKQESIESPETITAELERIAQLMVDLEVGFSASDATASIWNYDSEFSFKGSAGAARWINRPVFRAKCHKELEYNYDLDLVLQELLVNRIILKPKYFCSKGLTDVNEGGASSKDRKDQIVSINLMKSKWGKYFDYNLKSNKPYIRVDR